jgi:hypothetical protein
VRDRGTAARKIVVVDYEIDLKDKHVSKFTSRSDSSFEYAIRVGGRKRHSDRSAVTYRRGQPAAEVWELTESANVRAIVAYEDAHKNWHEYRRGLRELAWPRSLRCTARPVASNCGASKPHVTMTSTRSYLTLWFPHI